MAWVLGFGDETLKLLCFIGCFPAAALFPYRRTYAGYSFIRYGEGRAEEVWSGYDTGSSTSSSTTHSIVRVGVRVTISCIACTFNSRLDLNNNTLQGLRVCTVRIGIFLLFVGIF